jgi:hypothetical protein
LILDAIAQLMNSLRYADESESFLLDEVTDKLYSFLLQTIPMFNEVVSVESPSYTYDN